MLDLGWLGEGRRWGDGEKGEGGGKERKGDVEAEAREKDIPGVNKTRYKA